MKDTQTAGWLLAIILTIGSVLFGIYVAMSLWNWHIASYFHLEPVGMWQVLGIACAISIFKSHEAALAVTVILKDEYNELDGAYKKLIYRFAANLTLFSLGYMAKQFI